MSRRSRRIHRRVRALRRVKRRLALAYERMEATRGTIMNLAWLDAAAEATECMDMLARLGRPVSTKQAVETKGRREVVLACG